MGDLTDIHLLRAYLSRRLALVSHSFLAICRLTGNSTVPAYRGKQASSNMEMGRFDGADDPSNTGYPDYTGQYEAQDQTAVAQPVPQPVNGQTTTTTTSTVTTFTNGSAGQQGLGNGMAIEHAGPGYDKVVQTSRNF